MGYKLSSSKLNLFRDCPRCFWLAMKKNVTRPNGPMSSLPIKLDSIIKHYFDKYRMLNELPPILDGKVKGRLAVNMPLTLYCKMKNGIILWGRPDDYFVLEDCNTVVLDHKTASKVPTSVHPSYQLQMDIYSYMLKELGYKTTNKAFLAYYYPDDCDLHNGLSMDCCVIEVNTDPTCIVDLVEKANNVLNGPLPDAAVNCKFCKWTNDIIEKCVQEV